MKIIKGIQVHVAFIDENGLPDLKHVALEYVYESPYDDAKFRDWVVAKMKENRWRLIDLRSDYSRPQLEP